MATSLEEEYRLALQRRVRSAINLLSETTSQRRLEKLIGLSQGYLSRLRAGSGTPSTLLISHLALIALDPATHLEQLSRYWAATLDDTNADASSGVLSNAKTKKE